MFPAARRRKSILLQHEVQVFLDILFGVQPTVGMFAKCALLDFQQALGDRPDIWIKAMATEASVCLIAATLGGIQYLGVKGALLGSSWVAAVIANHNNGFDGFVLCDLRQQH